MQLAGVCTTKDIFDDWVKAQVSGDKEGLLQLIIRGQCFIAKQGERALVIDKGWTTVKIRMRSGPEQGNAGWTYVEAVNKYKE